MVSFEGELGEIAETGPRDIQVLLLPARRPQSALLSAVLLSIVCSTQSGELDLSRVCVILDPEKHGALVLALDKSRLIRTIRHYEGKYS